jgi:ParB family chromosome partitioning protein
MEPHDVSLIDIRVAHGRRMPKPAAVRALADSISELGLLSPIRISRAHALICGRTRLEAFRLLGRSKIPAVMCDDDALHAELAEIDENVVRTNLSALEESRAFKRRKQIYEALHPETKHGGAPGAGRGKTHKDDNLSSFSADTAAKTGQSRRTIERKVALAEAIPDDVAEQIADTPLAENASELAKLAKLPPEKQAKVAAEVKATNRATVAKKRPKPRKKPVLSEAKPEEPDHFMAAAEEWCRRWLDEYKPVILAAKLECLASRVRTWTQETTP